MKISKAKGCAVTASIILALAIAVPYVDDFFSDIDRNSEEFKILRSDVYPLYDIGAELYTKKDFGKGPYPKEIVVSTGVGDQYKYPNTIDCFDGELQYISGDQCFMFIHYGPDQVYEQQILDAIHKNKAIYSLETIRYYLISSVYDPTNGSISRGDIYYTSRNLGDFLGILSISLDKRMRK